MPPLKWPHSPHKGSPPRLGTAAVWCSLLTRSGGCDIFGEAGCLLAESVLSYDTHLVRSPSRHGQHHGPHVIRGYW